MTLQRRFVEDSEGRSDRRQSDVVTRVVSLVAGRAGVDPEQLEPRLYDVVEPEALRTVVETASADAALSLEFQYADFQVSIEAAEQVDIDVTPA